MGALPSEQYHRLQLSSDNTWSGNILTALVASLLSRHAFEARRTPFAAARGGRPPEALLLFVAPSALYRSQPDRCDAPDANLGDVAFFDKADDAVQPRPQERQDPCFRIGWWGGNDYPRAREVSYPFGASRVPSPLPAPIACSNDAPRTQSLG
jgi:hypothetical protein